MALTPSQLAAARTIFTIATSRGVPPARARELVAAALAESTLNPQATNRTSGAAGLFQLLSPGYRQRAQQLGGLYQPRANTLAILPDYQTYWWQHPNALPGEAGRDVERSGAGAGFYSAPLQQLPAFGGGAAADRGGASPAVSPPQAGRAAPGPPPAPDMRGLLAGALLRASRSGNYQGFFQTFNRVRQQPPIAPLGAQQLRGGPPGPQPLPPPAATGAGAYTHPAPGGSFLRVDQGVDYSSPSPPVSLGSGIVTRVSPPGSWAGGTGQAVYVHLDRPVTINGRTYRDVYYAEERPLVRAGQRVHTGQPVIAPGGNELGFAQGTQPAAPLVGGLGAGTRPTTPGQDFLQFVRSLPRR